MINRIGYLNQFKGRGLKVIGLLLLLLVSISSNAFCTFVSPVGLSEPLPFAIGDVVTLCDGTNARVVTLYHNSYDDLFQKSTVDTSCVMDTHIQIFYADFGSPSYYRLWVLGYWPVSPTCSDHNQNQGETGVDCGGPCPACPTCNDGIQNQGETGVDCGGPCGPCPTCTDGIQNQGETGVDCGGPCQPCPTCSDGIQNQGETGVDCGGPCAPCCLANISATTLTIDPSSGGHTEITGVATATSPLSACGLIIAGKTVDCVGSSASIDWKGEVSTGKLVTAGEIYPASFGFTTTSGCSASKSIDIKVIEGPKGPKICPGPL